MTRKGEKPTAEVKQKREQGKKAWREFQEKYLPEASKSVNIGAIAGKDKYIGRVVRAAIMAICKEIIAVRNKVTGAEWISVIAFARHEARARRSGRRLAEGNHSLEVELQLEECIAKATRDANLAFSHLNLATKPGEGDAFDAFYKDAA
jgi:hypothetical protein